MTRPLLSSRVVETPIDPQLLLEPVEPSVEVDARTRRLAHAALLAYGSVPSISRFEFALGAALVGSYAAYAASQVFLIFSRAV
jgi:hypothetical protein